MADDIEISANVSVHGASAAVAAIDGLSSSLSDLGSAAAAQATETTKSAEALTKQGEKTKLSGLEAAQYGASFKVAGETIGEFNKGLGASVSALSTAAEGAAAFAIGGLGPLGVAFTGINIAVSLLSAAFSYHKTKMEEARQENEEFKKSLDALVPSFDQVLSKMQQSRSDEQRGMRISNGSASPDEYMAAIEVANGHVRQISARQRRLLPNGLNSTQRRIINTQGQNSQELNANAREYARLETELYDTQQIIEDLQQKWQQAVARETARTDQAESALQTHPDSASTPSSSPPRRSSGRRPQGPTAEELAQQEQERAEREVASENALRAKVEAAAQALREQEEQAIALEKQSAERLREKHQRELDERTEHEWRITEMLKENEDKRLQEAEDAQERKVENYKKAAEYIETIGNATVAVYDFVSGAAADADESEEQKQKRELKRKAFAQAVEAVINTANAAAAFASFNYPSAIQYTVAAALNVAAAAKAGVDAGNVSAGAGAAGGGASGRSDELRRDATSSSSREPANITINMNGSVVATADRAELGRQLGQIIRMGDDRYGA